MILKDRYVTWYKLGSGFKNSRESIKFSRIMIRIWFTDFPYTYSKVEKIVYEKVRIVIC